MVKLLLKNNILRAYGTSLLGVASGLLTNLWLLREITHQIPPHDFGIYAFVLQVSGYLAIFQLGMDFAASRHIAESLGRSDPRGASRAFYDLWRFNRKIIFVGAAVVAGVSIMFWCRIGFKDSESAKLAGEIALIAGSAQLISFLTRPYSAALIGSQYQATVNIVTAVRTVATTLLAFCFLKAGFYILCVPAAEFLTQLGNLVVLRMFAEKKCLWKRMLPQQTDKPAMTSMIRFGGLTSLGGVAWTIEAGMDVMILGILTNVETVAAYVLWWRFPQMIFDFCSRLAFSAFPRFSQSFGMARETSRVLLSKVTYLTIGFATLALIGISWWLAPFVHLWIGINYTGQQSADLPLFMGLLVCLRTGGNLLGMFWLSSGRAELTTALAWTQAGVKLLLALWLIPRFGILGVVAASCAASLLQVGVMAIYLFREHLLMSSVIGRTLFLLGLAFLASLAGRSSFFHVGWSGLLGGVAATTFTWAAFWSLVAWTGELRTPLQTIGIKAAKRLRIIKAAWSNVFTA